VRVLCEFPIPLGGAGDNVSAGNQVGDARVRVQGGAFGRGRVWARSARVWRRGSGVRGPVFAERY